MVLEADSPDAGNPHANRLTVGILALVAEDEAERISARTKAALAAAKARGVKLGGYADNIRHHAAEGAEKSAEVRASKADKRAADLASVIASIRAEGASSLRAIAAEMNRRGITTSRGGEWSAVQVSRVIERAA